MKQNNISHIKKREIQAPIVTSIVKEFIKELGKEKALAILSRVIEKDAVKSGQELARQFNGNSMKELVTLIKEIWCKDEAMEIEVLRETDSEFHFNVIRCKYAEIYNELGEMELGKCLSCDRDFPFNKGFNPEIKLKRSKTIMEGMDICDFRYTKISLV